MGCINHSSLTRKRTKMRQETRWRLFKKRAYFATLIRVETAHTVAGVYTVSHSWVKGE